MSKPDEMLSEQKHLRQCLNQCSSKNSIIDHAINFNKRHNTKTTTSIQKNKCYVAFLHYGVLSENMKRIFQDYDNSTQFTAVITLKNSLVHHRDKQQKAVKVMLCMKFVATLTLPVMMHALVRHLNHYSIVLDNIVDVVTMEMIKQSSNTQIASGHLIDVNDVTILDRAYVSFPPSKHPCTLSSPSHLL